VAVSYCLASQILPLSAKSVACETKREPGLLLVLCGPLLLITLPRSPHSWRVVCWWY